MGNESSARMAAPVSQQERITILDSLRGIAVLGILLMNITGFALPSPAYHSDLGVMNEIGTINQKTWFIVEWSLEGTQRALFSMLFGAGIILFLSRQEKRSGGLLPADYFFRRQLWLLVFGLIHAYVLLWFWEILFPYACCGMILFAFRKWPPKTLIIAAIISLLIMTLRENADLYREKAVIHRGEIVAKLDTTKTQLSFDQKDQLQAMMASKERSSLESRKKEMENSLQKVRGDYATIYKYQSGRSFNMETVGLFNFIWDFFLFMFLGMAFYKNGILTGNASVKVYWLMCILGLSVGLLLSWYRLQPIVDHQFNRFNYTKNVAFEFYEISRTFRAIGFFGLIMLLYKSNWFQWLFNLMRPVGQMAFTNYLMQSIMCGLFFYGIGFGYFGKLERYQIYFVVVAVWILEIIWSHIWLKYFLFGPFEWCWRSLTYWKKQPLRKPILSQDDRNIVT
jgi:uncharacterized protein